MEKLLKNYIISELKIVELVLIQHTRCIYFQSNNGVPLNLHFFDIFIYWKKKNKIVCIE